MNQNQKNMQMRRTQNNRILSHVRVGVDLSELESR